MVTSACATARRLELSQRHRAASYVSEFQTKVFASRRSLWPGQNHALWRLLDAYEFLMHLRHRSQLVRTSRALAVAILVQLEFDS